MSSVQNSTSTQGRFVTLFSPEQDAFILKNAKRIATTIRAIIKEFKGSPSTKEELTPKITENLTKEFPELKEDSMTYLRNDMVQDVLSSI